MRALRRRPDDHDPAGTYWIDATLFDEDFDFFDVYSLRADKLD